MDKCSPSETRKNLLVVQHFVDVGMDFVAVPVKNAEHKAELIQQSQEIFSELISEAGND